MGLNGIGRLARARPYAVAFLADCGNALFVFTLTRRLAEGGGSPLDLGVWGTCNSLSYALAAALFGHLADRLGPRRLIAGGGLLLALSYAGALARPEWPWVLAWAVSAGIAVAAIFPPLISLISGGRAGGGTRHLILFCLAWNGGMISGQTGGGLLFSFDPSRALIAGAAVGLAIAGIAPLLRPAAPVAAAVERPAAVDASTGRFFAVYGWLANVSSAFCMSLILYALPKLLTQLEVAAPQHGLMLTGGRVAVVLTYVLLHFTQFWRHRLWPALAVQTVAIGGLWVLGTATHTVLLAAGVAGIGVMMGYNYFSGIFYSTTGFARRGLASGLHEASIAAGFTVGAVGGGLVGLYWGLRLPYLLCIGPVCLFALVQVGAYWRLRRRVADPGR